MDIQSLNRSQITSLSAPVSIIVLTEMELLEETWAILTGIIGLITWSSALTDSVEVVAASHNVTMAELGCCCYCGAAFVDAVCGC